MCHGNVCDKDFRARNSVLTDLYHVQALRHFCVTSLILWFGNNVLLNAYGNGSTKLMFRYFRIGFGQFDLVIKIWTFLFLYTLLMHSLLFYWAQFRNSFKPKCSAQKFCDFTFLLLFLFYCIFFLILLPCIKNYDLPIASSATLLGEHVRMLMKMHAFARSNIPNVLSYKKNYSIPSFSKYLYFHFAPTFIYKDSYPRTEKIRWSFVTTNLLEFIACLLYLSLIVAHYLVPDYKDFAKHSYNWKTILVLTFQTIVPGTLIMIFGFYLMLHAWLNTWAELLKFADREFYSDWWNASNYNTYFRKWNLVVYNYLHTYVYKDVVTLITNGNRTLAICITFFISALVHEYILAFMFGFCLPINGSMFILFGLTFYFVRFNRFGNLFFWLSFTFGSAIQACLFTMEYYARLNCPQPYVGFVRYYFLPRFFTCQN